jgi:hypothetical protein
MFQDIIVSALALLWTIGYTLFLRRETKNTAAINSLRIELKDKIIELKELETKLFEARQQILELKNDLMAVRANLDQALLKISFYEQLNKLESQD